MGQTYWGGRGKILGTSNRSSHTHSETSSICRYTERHEQQQGGRNCILLHLCSPYQHLIFIIIIIVIVVIQTTILVLTHICSKESETYCTVSTVYSSCNVTKPQPLHLTNKLRDKPQWILDCKKEMLFSLMEGLLILNK